MEGMGRSVSLSSSRGRGGVEGSGLEPSIPLHGLVNANFRKIILRM